MTPNEYNKMSASDKKKEDWMTSKWRPACGWMYITVCSFDFMIGPILWATVQMLQHQQLVQWQPLTLQGAGLFHIAMGAVLGISAFGRSQEKIAGNAVNNTQPQGFAPAQTFPPPAAFTPAPSDPLTRNTRSDA